MRKFTVVFSKGRTQELTLLELSEEVSLSSEELDTVARLQPGQEWKSAPLGNSKVPYVTIKRNGATPPLYVAIENKVTSDAVRLQELLKLTDFSDDEVDQLAQLQPGQEWLDPRPGEFPTTGGITIRRTQ